MIPPRFPHLSFVAVVCACSIASFISAQGADEAPAKEKVAAEKATVSPYPKKAVFPKTPPASVVAYRAELQKPGALATAILSAACEMRGDRFEAARAEIAFAAMWTDAELDQMLAAQSKDVRARAEAASARKAKAGDDEEALGKAAHEAAAEWLELSRLLQATGEARDASEAATQRLQALTEAATPLEWLDASLAAAPLIARAGKPPEAEQLLEKCKALRTKAEELRGSVVADANLLLAEARLRNVSPPSRFRNAAVPARGEAVGLYARATAMLEKELGRKHPATIECLEEWVGAATSTASREADTLKLCERLLALREEMLGPEHPATIRAVALVAGQTPAAEADKTYQLTRRMVLAWLKGAGLGQPGRRSYAQRFAIETSARGETADAEKLHRALYTTCAEMLGPEHRQTLWHANDLAIAIGDLGDAAAAEKLNREVLALRVKTFGPEESNTLTSMNNTAVSVSAQGRYREALELYEKTLALRIKVSGADDRETLRVQSNIAGIQHTLGDFDAAEKLHTATFEARRKHFEMEDTDTMTSKLELARLTLDRGDAAKAAPICEEVVASRTHLQGAEHPATLDALVLRGRILLAQGKTDQAVAQLRTALESHKKRLGATHPATQYASLELGEALLQAGDVPAAEPLLRGVSEDYQRRLGPAHPDTLETISDLGQVALKKRDFAAAEPLLRRALEGYEKAFDAQHPTVGNTLEHLAETLEGKGDKAGASPLAERALAIAERKLVKTAPARLQAEALVKRLRE
jgi:tetratricopeptide (TPR) repeat protein